LPFQAGFQVADPVLQIFNGQEVEVWPRITWKPKWGLTFSSIKSKVSGNCSISHKSTLAIKGQKIFIENLSVDGALIIDAVDDAEVFQYNLSVFNLDECFAAFAY
jgi:UDP-sugar pyrophosphorylase